MLLPVKWLRDYVDIDASTKEISEKITDTGSHVESIEDRSVGLSNVVVGKILKIENHPNADKLVICTIDTGDEELTIVTGAKNVFEGAIVPVAKVGAKLAKGMEIKDSELRGVASHGMLCSLGELGLDSSVIAKEYRNGIYIFPEGTEIGQDAIKALDLDSEIIEFEITPNRPDCLSIIGMARETAATFDIKLKEPEIKFQEEDTNIKEVFNDVKIETSNCRRFYSKAIRNVKIEESPLWMQNYLMAAGVRPTNNIVDITNFVMLEYGQPLHAYDLDKIETKEILVRMAKEGEELLTLDNQKRKLKNTDIVISDGKEAIGLAGVMGGFDTEVTENTVNVLLEGANFDQDLIRDTARRLQLRSEASAKFEKGIDPNIAKIGVDRAAQLIKDFEAGEVLSGCIDAYEDRAEEKVIKLRPEKVNKLIGFEISPQEMVDLLERLEIKSKIEGDHIVSIVPTFRLDLSIEEDLIEEIARIYGYHNIEPKPLEGTVTVGGRSALRNLEIRIKESLFTLGFNELITFSFVGDSNFDKLNLKKDNKLRDAVRIINPLGDEFSVMRTTLISNLLENLSYNEHRDNNNVAAFEFGNTFKPENGDLPSEEKKLSLGFYDIGDFYYLKEAVREIFWKIGIKDLEFKRANVEFLHPGRSAEVYYNGVSYGVFGEVHPNVLKNFDMKKRAFVGELLVERLLDFAIPNYIYKELPKYPATKRDLAFILDEDVDSYSIEKIVKKNAKDLLEKYEVFDVYTGEGIDDGMKSLAFSVIFRANDRTLKDEEVNEIIEKIIEDITKDLSGKLRE
ncbi:phenylalanine--tRNA ligase subunit beta [Peptoniphilus obesi]|uniref:phenylalanine--tRNA ligase subunit beta n=1 Tax=Peptoniphilus obesi TaxID=1472765 RepID=UPI0004BB2534|nr:phenylalanine--tRNA ligase subunit beta [Peptoniphilus obesi]